MWWLSMDVVAQWGCGGSVEMWWLRGDVVAQWGCGGSVGDVVAQLAKATG
jgi:NADPH:quinone reductase-like Zn-dependent oxidoreductase